MIRLSRAIANQGSMVDELMSNAIERMAFKGLGAIRDSQTEQQRRFVVRHLIALGQERQDIEELISRDTNWGRIVLGWRLVLWEALQIDADLQAALNRNLHRVQATTRLLIVDMELKNHQANHGVLPERLDELGLDEEFIRDPFSPVNDKLKYSINGDQVLLYSLGPDQNDDQGTPPAGGEWVGDGAARAWIGDGDHRLDVLYPAEGAN